MKTPLTIEDITPEWLTWVLTREEHLSDAAVVGFEARPIGVGIGFLSSIAQISLQYDRQESAGPESVVVKLGPSSPALRNISDEVHAFEREVRFYREVAPLAPIRLPRCYHASLEPPNAVLVLEDLTFATPCDQVQGLHATAVVEVARLIGRLQGKFWNNDALARLNWMPTTNRRLWVHFDDLWNSFLSDFGGTLDASARQLGQRLLGKCQWLEQEVDLRPPTLVHSVLKADNVLFGPPGTPEAILILDWQLAIRSMGVFDVARLMGGSELPMERHGHQLDVLRAWFDAVHESDVEYDWEQALRDLRLGGLQMVCWAIQFYAFVAGSQGRPRELVTRICERAFDSAVEMNAGSILPPD